MFEEMMPPRAKTKNEIELVVSDKSPLCNEFNILHA